MTFDRACGNVVLSPTDCVDMNSSSIVATANGWTWTPFHKPLSSTHIRVRVAMAGLCRTDIHAMKGDYPLPQGRILGHEAAGWVQHIPTSLQAQAAQRGIVEGMRVAFFPFVSCRQCAQCAHMLEWCPHRQALGLDVDGAFSPFVDCPLEVLAPAPDNLSWQQLAYAEPVAAALGVLHVPVLRTQPRVAVLGSGRIATLTQRVLNALRAPTNASAPSLPMVPCVLPDDLQPNAWDVVVETWATTHSINKAVQGVCSGGTIVLKSRPAHDVLWPHRDIVLRQINLVGSAYGSFRQGLAWMSSHQLNVDDMLGPVFAWDNAGVLAALALEAQGQEKHGKLFFDIAGVCGTPSGTNKTPPPLAP